MLDAEMNAYYWSSVCDRYTLYDKCLKGVVAVAASGTVAAWGLWAQYPLCWKLLSGVASLVAVLSPFICSSDDLRRMSGLVTTWQEILINYELLWQQDGNLSSTKSWEQFEATRLREAKIDETRLPKKKKLIQRAFEHVHKKRGLSVSKQGQ
jgi:hypothetical protein